MIKSIVIGILVLFFQAGFYTYAGEFVSNILNQSQSLGMVTNNHPVVSQKDVLFIVKHCKSPNIVVYQANRTSQKDLDPEKPVDVYWLMNTKGKKTESLTYIEWKMAFGFKLNTLVKGKKYTISLNAVKDKEITISQNTSGEFEGFIKINGVFSKLKDVFVNFEYSFGLPDVKYVDFTGFDLKSGKLITERIWA
ncbi:MAG: DUF4833 domain-containing protein [Bacteroidales bacterium]|nr:DUF4833 domain-containing protein [Bacteroidales bacterium]